MQATFNSSPKDHTIARPELHNSLESFQSEGTIAFQYLHVHAQSTHYIPDNHELRVQNR